MFSKWAVLVSFKRTPKQKRCKLAWKRRQCANSFTCRLCMVVISNTYLTHKFCYCWFCYPVGFRLQNRFPQGSTMLVHSLPMTHGKSWCMRSCCSCHACYLPALFMMPQTARRKMPMPAAVFFHFSNRTVNWLKNCFEAIPLLHWYWQAVCGASLLGVPSNFSLRLFLSYTDIDRRSVVLHSWGFPLTSLWGYSFVTLILTGGMWCFIAWGSR